MTGSTRRATAVAGLAAVSLTALVVDPGWTVLAGVVVMLGAIDGPSYWFDRPFTRSRNEIGGFLAAVLGLGALTVWTTFPLALFVVTVVLGGYTQVAAEIVRRRNGDPVTLIGAFCIGGAVAGTAVGAGVLVGLEPGGLDLPALVVLAACGALLAAVLVDRAPRYRDGLVVAGVGPLLWGLWVLLPALSPAHVAIALAVTGAIGYLSYALGTASPMGMLTGVLLALVTIVLGGYGWFLVLIAFFGIGGLSTKFRYEEKTRRGVAEHNAGARGSENVLGNAAVALVAVLGYAAATAGYLEVASSLFLFAFTGAIATAMSDTLSSEIGSVYDGTRLITTLEPVEPGTDGGVTWQGELAGLAGAALVAVLCVAVFGVVSPVGGVVVLLAGMGGMTLDSLIGATLEGRYLGNQGVNFVATLGGGLLAVALSLPL